MSNEVVMYLLGGGVVSLIIGVLTIRAKVRKVIGETESLNLQNSQSATHILVENIVEPLKVELHATRKEFNDTKKEMQLLRRAIRCANYCEYHVGCPVLQRMREFQKGEPGKGGVPGV